MRCWLRRLYLLRAAREFLRFLLAQQTFARSKLGLPPWRHLDTDQPCAPNHCRTRRRCCLRLLDHGCLLFVSPVCSCGLVVSNYLSSIAPSLVSRAGGPSTPPPSTPASITDCRSSNPLLILPNTVYPPASSEDIVESS